MACGNRLGKSARGLRPRLCRKRIRAFPTGSPWRARIVLRGRIRRVLESAPIGTLFRYGPSSASATADPAPSDESGGGAKIALLFGRNRSRKDDAEGEEVEAGKDSGQAARGGDPRPLPAGRRTDPGHRQELPDPRPHGRSEQTSKRRRTRNGRLSNPPNPHAGSAEDVHEHDRVMTDKPKLEWPIFTGKKSGRY